MLKAGSKKRDWESLPFSKAQGRGDQGCMPGEERGGSDRAITELHKIVTGLLVIPRQKTSALGAG